MYINLIKRRNDSNANVDAVWWRGTRRRLSIRLFVVVLLLAGLAGATAELPGTTVDPDRTDPDRMDRADHARAAIGLAGGTENGDVDERSGVQTAGDLAGYVIVISVDGLRPDAITRQSPEKLPNFYRLREEGAFTDNARTDVDYINTLPNHVAQLTGRPVTGDRGHNWTSNGDPGDATIHSRKGTYVASVFDVVHDNGLRSAAYVSKSKLALLDQSYGGGFVDDLDADSASTGGKIDRFVYDNDSEDLVRRMVRDLHSDPTAFSFLHVRDPDSKGHAWSWSLRSWSPYMRSVRRVDRMLGRILDAIENDPHLSGNTTVILTADHGGEGWDHGSKTKAADYTIPFYAWGVGVAQADLYALNPQSRRDPGVAHPGFDARVQPIRNGDAANLALSLLGLAPVPGSTVNAAADLNVRATAEHFTNAGEVDGREGAGR